MMISKSTFFNVKIINKHREKVIDIKDQVKLCLCRYRRVSGKWRDWVAGRKYRKKTLERIQSRKFLRQYGTLHVQQEARKASCSMFYALLVHSARRVCRNQLLFRGLFAGKVHRALPNEPPSKY